MEINERTTTIPERGSVPESTSLPTEPSTQVAVPPEVTGQPKVEEPVSTPASQPPRREVSGFYHERKKVRELESLVKQILENQKLSTQQPKPPAEQPKKNYEEEFYKNPVGVVEQMIKDIVSGESSKVKEDIHQELSSIEQKRETAKQWQEVEKILVAKETESKDPNFVENLQQIVQEYGLEHWASKEPVLAIKKALELYVGKKTNAEPAKTPLVATKASMASTASGTPTTPQKPSTADVEKLFQELKLHPELANDADFKKRWTTLKGSLEKK